MLEFSQFLSCLNIQSVSRVLSDQSYQSLTNSYWHSMVYNPQSNRSYGDYFYEIYMFVDIWNHSLAAIINCHVNYTNSHRHFHSLALFTFGTVYRTEPPPTQSIAENVKILRENENEKMSVKHFFLHILQKKNSQQNNTEYSTTNIQLL